MVTRARYKMETIRGREAIVFYEVPYQVNKASVYERIGELVREKKVEGVAEVRDESNRLGIRLVCPSRMRRRGREQRITP